MEMRWIATVDIYTGEEAGDWLRLFHSSAACSPAPRLPPETGKSPRRFHRVPQLPALRWWLAEGPILKVTPPFLVLSNNLRLRFAVGQL